MGPIKLKSFCKGSETIEKVKKQAQFDRTTVHTTKIIMINRQASAIQQQ